ncbi:MAG: hypothetical protein V4617_13735 [Gemmatimonadota bacterium]
MDDDWRRDVGTSWQWLLVALTIGCAVAGGLFPLIDPDLAMHLRTAEWIMQEGRVPYAEPFSWTRPGAPFYAYSWLAELLYWGAFTTAGALGLHLVHAFTAAGAFLTVVALGRGSRWTPWATLLVALMSFAIWIAFIGAVRPQALMGLTVPLSWLAAEWMVRGRTRAGLLLAFAMAVLTVNTHLLFPVTAMPVIRMLVEPRPQWRTAALFCVANGLGWLMTPYAFEFVEMMRINFTGNALIGPQTIVSELEPGFRAFGHAAISIRIATIILLLVPFAIPGRLLTDRERILYGLLWVGGLFLFGTAVRGLVIWLLAALPLLARAAAAIPLPQQPINRRVTAVATLLVPLGLLGSEFNQQADVPTLTATRATRQLPSPVAVVIEPLARFAECRLGVTRGARAYTVFNYGSYLVWRLPAFSYSIDGRNIYPDSVAGAEAYQTAYNGPMQLGPWRSADVAIAPLQHAVARALDAAPEWQLLRVSRAEKAEDGEAGLWAQRTWLATRGITAPAADTVRMGRNLPAPGACSAP